jgi:hypothetical protein
MGDRPGGLTTEGRNGAEYAAVQYALGLPGVVAPHTGNFGRVATVVQYVEHLVPRETPIRVRRYKH